LRRVTTNQIDHVLEQLDEFVRLPDSAADDHDAVRLRLQRVRDDRARRRSDLDEAGIDLDACLDEPLVPHRDCDLDGCRIEARNRARIQSDQEYGCHASMLSRPKPKSTARQTLAPVTAARWPAVRGAP
jgi:hypothetical protein